MRHLYCWHQPKQQSGSLVNNSDFLELSAKVEDLQKSYLQKSFFPVGTQHENCVHSFAIGHQSHVCNSYSTAIGVGAIARNRGEITISGGVENGGVISTVDLILGTGEVGGSTQPIFNETKDGSYWVSDEPYLEIRITDGAQDAHNVRKSESVKISIRKLFDLLCANGGVYKNEGFGEDDTNEDWFKYPQAHIIETTSYIPNADKWSTDFSGIGREVTVVSNNIAYGDE